MQQELLVQTQKLRYDTDVFPFRKIVEKQMVVDEPLEKLHEAESYELFTRENDQSTVFHRRFYDIGEDFYDTYRSLLEEIVRPFVGESIVYQRIPTFRVSLPGNVAVGEFHVDADYEHGEEEINFWLPVTDAQGTNSVWVESAPGKADYQAQSVQYGEILVFDGVHLSHGNKENETDRTRVSFDFRAIPESKFVERPEAGSVNMGSRFIVGEYFERLS